MGGFSFKGIITADRVLLNPRPGTEAESVVWSDRLQPKSLRIVERLLYGGRPTPITMIDNRRPSLIDGVPARHHVIQVQPYRELPPGGLAGIPRLIAELGLPYTAPLHRDCVRAWHTLKP